MKSYPRRFGKPQGFDACTKIRHATKADAGRHIKRLKRVGSDTKPGTLEAYQCWRCGMWHVGHAKPPRMGDAS